MSAETTAKLKACCARLSSLRAQAAVAAPDDAKDYGAADALEALSDIAGLAVDVASLRESGIGREVNDRFIRTHGSEAVRDKSRELIRSWKSLAAPRADVPKDAAAPAAAASAAAPAREAATPASEGKVDKEDVDDKERKEKKDKKDKKDKKEKKEKKDKDRKRERSPEEGGDAKKLKVANRDLSAMFTELAGFEFKKGEKFKGIAYKKVAASITECDFAIETGKQASSLPGVGKESAKKIDEFLETGKLERLEKYRRGEMD